jgi:hypothetical protein
VPEEILIWMAVFVGTLDEDASQTTAGDFSCSFCPDDIIARGER